MAGFFPPVGSARVGSAFRKRSDREVCCSCLEKWDIQPRVGALPHITQGRAARQPENTANASGLWRRKQSRPVAAVGAAKVPALGDPVVLPPKPAAATSARLSGI